MPRFSRARWIMVGACVAALSLAGAAIVTAHNAPDKVQVLAHQINDRKPKNVIMFLGDGMGDSEITAARYYYAGAGGHLRMDALPVHRRADDLVGQAGARPDLPARLRARLGRHRHRVVDRQEDDRRAHLAGPEHRGQRAR